MGRRGRSRPPGSACSSSRAAGARPPSELVPPGPCEIGIPWISCITSSRELDRSPYTPGTARRENSSITPPIRSMFDASWRKSSSRCNDDDRCSNTAAMSITWFNPGRSLTFSANSSRSARSCSISSRALGRLHLGDDPFPGRQGRSMHLGDRAGRQRLGIDRLEHVFPRHAHLAFHDLDDLAFGERVDVILQRRELLDELGWQQVRSRREHLAQLREGRAQFFERRARGASPDVGDRRRRPRRVARTAPSVHAWRRRRRCDSHAP